MILYVVSQLIGSTLALDYMRAGGLFSLCIKCAIADALGCPIEYVAPLGSASLIFNFLFARFLVGTPVTNTDINVS